MSWLDSFWSFELPELKLSLTKICEYDRLSCHWLPEGIQGEGGGGCKAHYEKLKMLEMRSKGTFTLEPRWVSSWDEFWPGMITFSFFVSVFILGSGTKVVPPELNSSRPCLHKHSSCMELSSWEDCLHGIFRHISFGDDISSWCLGQGWNHPGMKSSRDEIVSTESRKWPDTEMNIHPGTKVIPGIKRALSALFYDPHFHNFLM